MTTLATAELSRWLREEREDALAELWGEADAIRRRIVGDEVHLRGLIEISNHCVRQCHYCGVRAGNPALTRYRMSADDIVACARSARDYGYGTVVLQSGEDPGLTGPVVADVVRRIKAETGLAVTLSLGERDLDELALWREAGADRYLLRFETSNRALFRELHPPRGARPEVDRVALLLALRELGYEIGSGVMIGLPGQTHEDLARDLLQFRELDLDMIGVGPFIAHPATPLGRREPVEMIPDQAPASERLTYTMIALTRLLCPYANIPSTTALATVNPINGRERGLQRGANVLMPNLTPPRYRVNYEIYPGKACISETAELCHGCLEARIRAIGRRVGRGPGSALGRVTR